MNRAGATRINRFRKRVLIVDSDTITRTGLARLLSCQKSLHVCGEAGTAFQAKTEIKTLEPDLVITDLNLPDKSGLDFIREIEMLHPNIAVLVLSSHDETLFAERALRAGARGYLMKKEGIIKLVEAIRQVLTGKIYVSSRMSTQLLEGISQRAPRGGSRSALGVLTDREFDVFQLLGEGLTTQEIGKRLHLSPKTINTHRLHIKEKLNMESTPQLIKYAVRWAAIQGLI